MWYDTGTVQDLAENFFGNNCFKQMYELGFLLPIFSSLVVSSTSDNAVVMGSNFKSSIH
jgi:hypothetical protein